MRKLLFFTFSLSVFFLNAQITKPTYAWKSADQLQWKDYHAKPNNASSFQALTATGVSFSIKYEENTLTIKLINSFDPSASWTKTNENDRLLAHERLHFDISELFARKLRKEILETSFESRGKKLVQEISEMYQIKMKELANFQKKYDEETEHSIVDATQIKWEAEVQQELKKLEDYSSSEIFVHLGPEP